MPLIILIVSLSLLKYCEIWRFDEMSWWWVIGLFGITVLWFEFLEPMLGLDKRKAHDEQDRIRKKRVKETFEQQNKRK